MQRGCRGWWKGKRGGGGPEICRVLQLEDENAHAYKAQLATPEVSVEPGGDWAAERMPDSGGS